MYVKNIEEITCLECGDKEIVQEIAIGKTKFYLCNRCLISLKLMIDSEFYKTELIANMILNISHLSEENAQTRERFIKKVDRWLEMAPKNFQKRKVK